MQGRVEWTGGTSLNGINAAGQSISMDWETGPSPMQLTLQMVGACSLVDVVIGLKERPFSNAWVDLDSTRADTQPRRFTSITMVYHVVGDVPQKLVERVVAKSHEKYCSVSASLDPEMAIDWRVEIHPPSEA
jgi:putative redox protein